METTAAHPMTEARKKAGISMRVLALAMGCDKTHISRIESRKHLPSPALANRLAEYFQGSITRDELLYPADYAKPTKKPVQSVSVEVR